MFVDFETSEQQNLIAAWTPVVETILNGFSQFPKDHFEDHIPYFYNLYVKLLKYGFGVHLVGIFDRIGSLYHIPKRNLSRYNEPTLFPSLESLVQDIEVDELATELVAVSLRGSVASFVNDVDPFPDANK
jgi:hypothetical protein